MFEETNKPKEAEEGLELEGPQTAADEDAEEEEEEEDQQKAMALSTSLVQRSALGSADQAPEETGAAASASPQNLPDETRGTLERSFGADLSSVRVHVGDTAAQVGAKAFTVGEEIHVNRDEYRPGDTAGKELLGHEVSHVLQQRAGRVAETTQFAGVPGNADATLEREADQQGAIAARGEPARIEGMDPRQNKARGAAVQRMPSGREMLEQAGPVKQGRFKKSPTYSKILAAVHAYHTDSHRYQVQASRLRRNFGAAVLLQRLNPLEALLRKYVKGHKRSRKKRKLYLERVLNDILPRERDCIQRIATEPAYDEPGMVRSWFEALALARTGVRPRSGIKVTTFGQDTRTSGLQALGAGAVNEVSEATFQPEGGDAFQGVYKQEIHPERRSDPEQLLNIPEEDRNYAARNVAMSRLNELLHLSVIPKTDFTIYDGYLGTVMEKVSNGKHVSSMVASELTDQDRQTAAGYTVDLFENDESQRRQALKNEKFVLDQQGNVTHRKKRFREDVDWNDPVFAREMANLQLMDVLTQQSDRHQDNYMLERDDDGNITGVKGIDNDFAFSRGEGANSIAPNRQYNLHGVPDKLDEAVARRVLEVTPQQVRATIEGILAAEEVTATVERFRAIQDYVRENIDQMSVGNLDQWRGIAQNPDAESKFGVQKAQAGALPLRQ